MVLALVHRHGTCRLIDYFALALTHALILLALLRVLGRGTLDRDDDDPLVPDEAPADVPPTPREKRRLRREGRDDA